jgi:hypothetical protein
VLFEKFQYEINTNGVKIISMVRDPISQILSEMMQGTNFARGCVWDKSVSSFKERVMGSSGLATGRYAYHWFEKHMEPSFGINVFDFPFDRDKGYSVIRKGKIEILMLTMESLRKNEKAIGDFVGIDDFKLSNKNISEHKPCKYVYERLKNELKLPTELLDEYYKNENVRHFYTDLQLDQFRSKWE